MGWRNRNRCKITGGAVHLHALWEGVGFGVWGCFREIRDRYLYAWSFFCRTVLRRGWISPHPAARLSARPTCRPGPWMADLGSQQALQLCSGCPGLRRTWRPASRGVARRAPMLTKMGVAGNVRCDGPASVTHGARSAPGGCGVRERKGANGGIIQGRGKGMDRPWPAATRVDPLSNQPLPPTRISKRTLAAELPTFPDWEGHSNGVRDLRPRAPSRDFEH